MRDAALQRAIDTVGGVTSMADQIKRVTGREITVSGVSQWKLCPPHRVLVVSQVSGVPSHELRPDLYPAPTQEQGRVAE